MQKTHSIPDGKKENRCSQSEQKFKETPQHPWKGQKSVPLHNINKNKLIIINNTQRRKEIKINKQYWSHKKHCYRDQEIEKGRHTLDSIKYAVIECF